MSSKLQLDVCFLAWVATSGECLRGEGLVWLIGAVVCLLAACRGSNCTLTRAKRCNVWPQFALQHDSLLPINCHFLRLYSAVGRGIAAVVVVVVVVFSFINQLSNATSTKVGCTIKYKCHTNTLKQE